MITREILKTAALALRRAAIERESASWVPVFADVVLDGEKIGNVTSDGYSLDRAFDLYDSKWTAAEAFVSWKGEATS